MIVNQFDEWTRRMQTYHLDRYAQLFQIEETGKRCEQVLDVIEPAMKLLFEELTSVPGTDFQEMLFMYYWLHDMEGDNDYWQEYLETVLPALKKQ